MDEEVKKAITEEIGKLGATLVEVRERLDKTEKKVGEAPGELKDAEARITEALVPQFLSLQTGENIQKHFDQINTRIDALKEIHKDAGVDLKKHERAVREFITAGTPLEPVTPESREFLDSEEYRKYIAFGMKDYEKRTLTEGTGSAGGIFVTPDIDDMILKNQINIDPVRAIAEIRTIGAPSLKRKRLVSGDTAYWETEVGSGTASQPKWADIEISAHALIVKTPVSLDLLADWPGVSAEITSEATIAFDYRTGVAYVAGTGAGQPMGFTTNVDANNALYPASSNSASTDIVTGDDFATLQVALPSRYWPNATWCFNSNTLGVIMKLKATTGNYLWQPGLQLGSPPTTILGRPFVIMETLSNQGSDVYPLWYGDFRQGYIIVDRQGILLMRDDITSWPTVNFNWRLRTGGQVQKAEAIKALKTT